MYYGSSYSWRRDVREICCDTWGVDNIVQGQLGDERAGLEEERQWLLGYVLAQSMIDCVEKNVNVD
jgi:hypothetical protein